MMYPFMTLDDGTEVVHSEAYVENNMEKVKVYFEKPVEGGFESAYCYLPEYRWDQIIGFSNRFAKRKIGLILNSSENKTYTIFDVFDGDPAEKKYSKRRSSLLFETGLEYFLEDRPLQARSCFIELLKYDRSDRIAKRYIQLCDKAINGTADDTRDKYLTVI